MSRRARRRRATPRAPGGNRRGAEGRGRLPTLERRPGLNPKMRPPETGGERIPVSARDEIIGTFDFFPTCSSAVTRGDSIFIYDSGIREKKITAVGNLTIYRRTQPKGRSGCVMVFAVAAQVGLC